jgi:hypothetical protein
MKHGGEPDDYECPDCERDCIAYTELKTKTIDEVEVLRTGMWKGLQWTKEHLKHVIKNFRDKIAKIGVKVTEDGTHEGKPLVMPGGASLGWADKLWLAGDRLMARFVQVPEKIANLIAGGPLSQKSIEGREHFHSGDGKDRGRALTGCLFFGANGIPAVHGLSDAVKLYQLVEAPSSQIDFSYTEQDYEPTDETSDNDPKRDTRRSKDETGGASMGDITLKQDEYKDLLATKAAHETLQKEKTQADEKNAEMALQLESSENARKKAEEDLKVYKDRDDRRRRDEIASFVHQLVKEGKIKKASEEAEIRHMLALSEEDLKDRQETLVKLQSAYGDQVENPPKPTADAKASDELDLNALDESAEKALAYQKEHPDVSFTQAVEAVRG